MNNTNEKSPLDGSFEDSITEYPLHNKLLKMDNMAFLAWLESEVK